MILPPGHSLHATVLSTLLANASIGLDNSLSKHISRFFQLEPLTPIHSDPQSHPCLTNNASQHTPQSLSLSLPLALCHFFRYLGGPILWQIGVGRLFPLNMGYFQELRKTRRQEMWYVVGYLRNNCWILWLWSPGAMLAKFQVAYPCFFWNGFG